MNRRIVPLVIVLLCVFSQVGAQQAGIPIFEPQVLNTFPHDAGAYTQGLVLYNGLLYESTGANSVPSTLREVDPQTGEILRMIELARDPQTKEPYAEGLALVDDKLIQLTWRSGLAFVYDIGTFNSPETFVYEGEGWGLCYDGRYIFHSDGSAYLSVRDPQTFELIVKSLVTYQGTPINQLSAPGGSSVANLNELECVGDSVYANVWMSDLILQISNVDGRVTGLIDASNLLTEEERTELDSNAVLNGIAYNPEAETFYITGKNWPKMFEVKFVPKQG